MQAGIKDAGRGEPVLPNPLLSSAASCCLFPHLLFSYVSTFPSQLCQYPSCRVVSYLLCLLYTLLVLPIPYPKALVMLLPGHPFTSPHSPSLPQLTLYPPSSPRLMSDSVAPPATFQTPFI